MRGLCHLSKKKVIKSIMCLYKSDLVCLQKIKISSMTIEIIRSLGVDWSLKWTSLDAKGSAGGISLF